MSSGCSGGEDEVPTYWPYAKKTMRRAAAHRKIRFGVKILGRESGGRPLPSKERFSSYTPRRMF
jgi:hypothetical protein